MTNLDPTQPVRAFYRRYAPRYDHQVAWHHLTPAMHTLARDRARELAVAVALLVADAQALPFAAGQLRQRGLHPGLERHPRRPGAVVVQVPCAAPLPTMLSLP